MKNSIVVLLFLLKSVLLFAQEGHTEIIANPEVKAQYPGGLQQLYVFVADNFIVPDIENDVVTKLYISLIVDIDGTLSDIVVVKGAGNELDDEAVRVIALSAPWEPAAQNGVAVKSKITIPLPLSIKKPEIKALKMSEVDIIPQFPGGTEVFSKEVRKRLMLPNVDKDINVKIFVNFTIIEDGSIIDVKCVRDPGYGLGGRAVQAVKQVATKWTPGMKGGKPVKVDMTLPIIVKITVAKNESQPGDDMWQRERKVGY